MSHEELLERFSKLSDKEKKAFYAASTAIYFADNSDYETALWDVVCSLLEIPSSVNLEYEDNDKLASYLINSDRKS
jgi:hypothetical protein